MRLLSTALLVLFCARCAPILDEDPSRVDRVQVLAVASDPPEAAPGEAVQFRALVVSPTGEVAAPALRWSWCTDRRPLAELGPASSRCLAPVGAWLSPLGEGDTATGTLPVDGCALFGPNPPPTESGDVAGRPADPDTTGGYHQPLQVRAVGADPGPALAFTRLACGISGVTQAVSVDFTRNYRRNQHPAVEAFVRVDANNETPLPSATDAPLPVAPGSTLTLRVRWPACAEAPCAGAEPYLRLDPSTRTLAVQRESLSVRWATTAGRFAAPRTGRNRDSTERSTDNRFAAPTAPGVVTLWAILRDDRGGVSWQSTRLVVGP